MQGYVHAGNCARANCMAMEGTVQGEGINICAGSDTSQRRIVDIALHASGTTLKPEYREDANSLFDCFHNVNGENLFEGILSLCAAAREHGRPITFM